MKLMSEITRDLRRLNRRVILGLILVVIAAHAAPLVGIQLFAGVQLAAVTVTLTAGLGTSANVSQDYQEWSVIMTANTDTTTGNVAHLMGAFAKTLIITAITAVGSVSAFFQSALTATNWAITNGSTQAGAAAAQVKVRLERAK